MSFDSYIQAAKNYSPYLDMQAMETTFRSTVKDKFMSDFLAFKATHTADQTTTLIERIKAVASKAAKKVADWTKKSASVEQSAVVITDDQVLASAQAFEQGCRAMRANERYVAYRAVRKELKDAVTNLGKQDISVDVLCEKLNTQLDPSKLGELKAKVQQLYKYSSR